MKHNDDLQTPQMDKRRLGESSCQRAAPNAQRKNRRNERSEVVLLLLGQNSNCPAGWKVQQKGGTLDGRTEVTCIAVRFCRAQCGWPDTL